MLMVAVMNNLPELVMALTWTTVVFWAGRKFEAWRQSRRAR